MRKTILLSATAILLLALAACVVPEKFTAKYEIKPDGNYTFEYDGTLVNVLSKMAKAKNESDDEELRKFFDSLKNNPAMKSIKDAGPDTYKVVMEESGSLMERSHYFFDDEMKYWRLEYRPDDNTVLFKCGPFEKDDMGVLDEYDIKPDGKIVFSTKCKVIAGEDKLEKSFFGGSYTLKLDRSIAAKGVSIIFQLEGGD